MELSLDDIIKKGKVKNGTTGRGITKKFAQSRKPVRKTLNKAIFKESRPVVDARLKILQNNRAKIRDARDKLVAINRIKGDARRLIQSRRPVPKAPTRNGVHVTHRNGRLELTTNRNPEPKPRRHKFTNVIEVPRGYVDYDNMDRIEQEEYNIAHGLSRTVHNDIGLRVDTYSPPLAEPPAPIPPRRLNSWGSQSSEHFDPFDVYEVSHTRRERRLSPHTELPPPPPKGILRPSSRQMSPDLYQRRYAPESASHLSYEMRSRLENTPDPHASMGIFSNPLRSQPVSHHSPNGYRIVVSNLHPTVTQSDIRELFEDIGELYDSRIVRPGVAEVIYKTLNDAEKAVDTYHNRQLDRQPMKCLLVNPRASDKPTAPAIKTSSSSARVVPGKTPLEIDIDALHKVLFRRH